MIRKPSTSFPLGSECWAECSHPVCEVPWIVPVLPFTLSTRKSPSIRPTELCTGSTAANSGISEYSELSYTRYRSWDLPNTFWDRCFKVGKIETHRLITVFLTTHTVHFHKSKGSPTSKHIYQYLLRLWLQCRGSRWPVSILFLLLKIIPPTAIYYVDPLSASNLFFSFLETSRNGLYNVLKC